ncbi:hypothetical protein MGSAQ_001273 [marine sediment metagenome]|uniref:Uncharacterized protein n=1 Tax=marine sediment metagenome TaxID=412755 RepID=A0A1B6NW83_9ZZZZ
MATAYHASQSAIAADRLSRTDTRLSSDESQAAYASVFLGYLVSDMYLYLAHYQ